jgi:hypothetical protein
VINRFGDEIDLDLWERGDNIREYMSPRYPLKTWRRLALIIQNLPEHSHFRIAVRNDPENALAVASAQREARAAGTGGKWHPPAEEWDLRTELEARLLDRLGEVVSLLADLPVAVKKRHKPPKPFPRPYSAVEEAEQQLAADHIADIIDYVEAGQVSDEEYRRMAAEVEEMRAAEEAARAAGEQEGGAHAVASTSSVDVGGR